MTSNELYTALDTKSQATLNAFVQSCLTLNIENINDLIIANPSLIKVSAYESDPIPFIDSVKEIFDGFKINSPIITVENSNYVDFCNPITLTKKFNVTYENNPTLNSNFGFTFVIMDNIITEIYECSASKSYQKRLDDRLFGGLNEDEIRELKQAIKDLPDL